MPPITRRVLSQRRVSAFFLATALGTTMASLAAFQGTLNPGNPSTLEDFKAGDGTRELYQKATELVAALQASPGDWVADVGAGAGYYSMRLCAIVGPRGKVLAEDISDSAIRWLNARVTAFGLSNIEVVKGAANDPILPADRLAAVLIVDSHHHFSSHQAMLDKILRALEPGGRLIIADYSLAEHRAQPRADQIKLHEIDPELARKEVGTTGFDIVKVDEEFVKWRPGAGNSSASATTLRELELARRDLWLITAVRPK